MENNIKKQIEVLEKEIELEKSINENNGNLSFLYHQLNELKKENNNEKK